MRNIKKAIYTIAKYLGIFILFDRLTARKLRILCYHGVSLDREHEFFNQLFITRETYQKRMEYLKRKGYPILSLEQAVSCLPNESYSDKATVITFDDGWSGVHSEISDLMHQLNFPWTLYLSTYYVDKQTQVFNIVFQYLIGTTQISQLTFVMPGDQGERYFDLTENEAKQKFYNDVYDAACEYLSAEQRQDLLRQLAEQLEVDVAWIFEKNCFRYVTREECKELVNKGVDIQLHTHRHTFPPNNLEQCKREIIENRKIIEAISGKPADHLCYPSGVYNKEQFKLMESLNVKSSTTVKAGMNTSSDHRYELSRFLDSEDISQIEFEAWMCGFSDFLRKVLS